MDITFPILKGTQAKYDAILTKDNEKLYITTDSGRIYLGDKLLSESTSTETVIPIVDFGGLDDYHTPGMVLWDIGDFGGIIPVFVTDASPLTIPAYRPYIIQHRFDERLVMYRFLNNGVWTEWEPINGASNADGDKIQLRVQDGVLQYKYETQVVWTDLYTFTDASGGVLEEIDPVYTADKPNIAFKTDLPIVPTKLGEFENDAGFITADDIGDIGGLPPGGTDGQVLTKTESGAAWQASVKTIPYDGETDIEVTGVIDRIITLENTVGTLNDMLSDRLAGVL